MTVSELITVLQSVPPDFNVVVSYEDGYNHELLMQLRPSDIGITHKELVLPSVPGEYSPRIDNVYDVVTKNFEVYTGINNIN